MRGLSSMIVFALCSLSMCVFAEGKITDEAPGKALVHQAIILEPKLGMRSGVESIVGLHRGWSVVEEQAVGSRWFSENTALRKTGCIALRFLKLAYLDMPVDYFTPVLLHEYFGHGSRYRELDIHDIHYAFDPPPPYGKGGGEASVNIDKPTTAHEEIAIWTGGLETHHLVNHTLSMNWISSREIDYREASLYFWTWQIMYDYVESSDDFEEGLSDNDPRAYVRILNRNEGITDQNDFRFTMEDLKASYGINLLNPFVFFSLYAQLKTYLYDGDRNTPLPMIPLGCYRYLPMLRTSLTPFGPEYHLVNYLRTPQRALLLDLRFGDRTFHESWGGYRMEVRNAYTKGSVSMDLYIDAWKQPPVETDGHINSSGGSLGGALSVRSYFQLSENEHPLLLLFELGYKTAGFAEGYALESSPILMIGAAFRD